MSKPPCAICGFPSVPPSMFGQWFCKPHRYACASAWLLETEWAGQQGRVLDDIAFVLEYVKMERRESER